jgi:hypothetical protein
MRYLIVHGHHEPSNFNAAMMREAVTALTGGATGPSSTITPPIFPSSGPA